MDTEAKPSDGDLFYEGLIQSYVNAPRFVERPWLAERIEAKLAEPDCRFLLLTAEPGAGKTAFMAWLAHQHPDWCRYFIRRDQLTPLRDVGAHSFLLKVGFQLAAIHPNVFNEEQLKISIAQRIGEAEDSKVIGARVSELFTYPFYQKVVQVQQDVNRSEGTSVTGLHIDKLYLGNRSLPIENLQYWALIDPAIALRRLDPNQRIIVLVDALDELKYQDATQSLLKWLADCPELPANLLFILTSRPDDALLNNFQGNQQPWLQQMTIEEEDLKVREDLTTYAGLLVQIPEVEKALKENNQAADSFVEQIVNKANGNFGYLDAIGRAVDTAILQNQQDLLKEILKLSDLPNTLQELYALFLGKIKDAVAKEMVPVEGIEGEIGFVPVWSYVYKPILGILSVAREPLTPTQIQKLGSIQAEFDYVTAALEKLRQFLDQLGNAYRLYHSTLPEFFTSPQTKEQTKYSYCYVDAVKQNQQIVNYYRGAANSWAEVNLKELVEDPYGSKHLTLHLIDANRVEELHTLLALETPTQRNAWFDAKEYIGDTVGFLQDISLAWKEAEAGYAEYQQISCIGLQCRYALINSSINSLATNLPNTLLSALVKHRIWKPAQGFAYARQVTQQHRATALIAVAPYSTELSLEEFIDEVLTWAEVIESPWDKRKVTKTVFSYLIEHNHLHKALTIAQTIEPFWDKAKILVKLVSAFAKQGDLREAITLMQEIWPDEYQAVAIAELANYLTEEFAPEILASIQKLEAKDQAIAWGALIPKLPETLRASIVTRTIVAAQTIEDQDDQALALALLLPYQSELSLGEILASSLSIRDNDNLRMALTSLAPCLSDELLSKLLEIIGENYSYQDLEISKTGSQIDAHDESSCTIGKIVDPREERLVAILMALLPCLPQKLLSQAMKISLLVKDYDNLVKVLQALVPRLPHDLLLQLLGIVDEVDEYNSFQQQDDVDLDSQIHVSERASVKVFSISGIGKPRVSAVLVSLAPYLSRELLPKAIEMAQLIDDHNEKVRVLAEIAVHQTEATCEKMLQGALTAVQKIGDREERERVAKRFMEMATAEKSVQKSESACSTSLEQKAVAEKLARTQAIQNPGRRAVALANLASYLSEELLKKVLDGVPMIEQPSEQSMVLQNVSSYLPEDLVHEALELAQIIEHQWQREQAIAVLVPQLAKSGYLQEALKYIPTISSNLARLKATAKVSSYLANSERTAHLRAALEETKNMMSRREDLAAEALASLGAHLTEELLHEGLKIARTIQKPRILEGQSYERARAEVLASMVSGLVKLPSTNLDSLWRETLPVLASRTRYDLLSDLNELILVVVSLGGSESLLETARAIEDVGRWWP